MTDLVPTEDIERIVGVKRHPTEHWGRAVSAEQTVYILHSAECLAECADLREDCLFSLALDQGIEPADWLEDVPLRLDIKSSLRRDWLIPAADQPGATYSNG